MKRLLLLVTTCFLFIATAFSQNVFDPNDPLVRYNANAELGSAQKPNTTINGLQKWVSTPSNGISTGGGSYDVTSYKAYFIKIGNTMMPFRLKFPKSYQNPDSAGKKYPVALFFHGAGEFGCPANNGFYNNEKQLVHGGKLFRDRVDNNQFDGFLLYPQAVDTDGCWGQWGSPSNSRFTIMNNILDSLTKYVRADPDRLFVFGLSAGGRAAWNYAQYHYLRAAAVAPSSAVPGSFYDYPEYVHIPIWFATGGKDTNPPPSTAQYTYNNIKAQGANIRYTLYPTLGHAVWNTFWAEPDFVPFMNAMHKANPLVFFQRNEFCPDSAVSAKIGIAPSFYAYEWEKDGVLIAKRVNGVNTIVDGTSITSFTGNEMVVKDFGTYRVRFKRKATSEFSVWSPIPAVIKPKTVTQTPPIAIDGMRSKVLPAPDGSTSVPLTLPDGYAVYEWYNASNNALITNEQTFSAPIGDYKARVKEEFGCGTEFSPVYKVVSAAGTPKPEPAKNLTAFAVSQTAIQIDWNENPNAGSNETGFEIYRSTVEGGPYTLIYITAPDVVTYTDQNLPSNAKYYYIVRAVNNYGAAARSNEASATTIADKIAPSAPTNLLYRGSSISGVSLQWNPATDNVGVVRYDIFVDNVKLYSTKTNSATVFGLDGNKSYIFTVKAIDAAGNISAPSNQVIGYTHNQGLNYKYYNGAYSSLPDFNSLTPSKTGVTDTINTGPTIRTQADNYAIYWQGYIYIPVAGTYTFETNSDDGSKLYINTTYSKNASALVNNDNTHGPQFKTGTITLPQGYHSIIVTFFEKTGGETMEAWWSNTAAGITRERIPKGYFALSKAGTFAAPATPSGLTATSAGYDRINLHWNDEGNDETGFEITRSTSSTTGFVPVGTVLNNTVDFADTGLNASTTYYYKIRSVSGSGNSVFIGPANAKTDVPPPAPAAPQNLKGTVLGVDAIQLEFDDMSSDETGFEIWRSVGDQNNFRKIAILSPAEGGKITYADNALFANITYYYKVRATGVGSASAYTSVINARTLNTLPVIKDLSDFTMKFSTSFSLPVNATDVDGDILTFTVKNMPSFATIQNISNGNINLVFKPRISNQGAYTMSVIVNDGNLGKDTTTFTMVVDDNAVPVMSQIDNIVINEGASIDVDVQANDAEGNDYLTWFGKNLPSFVSILDQGNGNAKLRVKPGYASSGDYTATVIVDDGFGAWTSRDVVITVVEKDPNEKIQANFRLFTGDVNGWNDIQMQTDGTTSLPAPRINLNNLLTSIGEPTTIGVEVVSGTYSASQTSALTGDNSGAYPDNILLDQMNWGFFTGNNKSDTVVLKVKGLKTDRKYDFVFFAGYNCASCGTTTSQVRFRNGNQTASIPYYRNVRLTDTLYDLVPNTSGEVLVTMIGDANTNYGGMLNALVINTKYDDGTKPAKPLDLNAIAYENLGVQLYWTDRAYNETNYKVYRSKTRTGTYSFVNTNGSYKDSSSYLDKSIEPYTTYYYYVAGINENGQGESSDTVEVITRNNIPQIIGLDNLFVKTDGSADEDFEVSDDPDEVLTVSIVNKPSFVELQSMGNNQYRLSANPTVDNVGWFTLTVKVQDDKGAYSTSQMTISVADKFTRSVFVNLGSTSKTAPAPWNNWTGSRAANSSKTNLLDEKGINTGFTIRSLTKWTTTTDLGMITGNNTGVYPDAVLESGVVNTTTNVMQLQFEKLNPSMRYNIVFVGAMNEGVESYSVYSSGTEKDTVDSRYNAYKTANLNGLVPDANNMILVNIERIGAGTAGYLNAVALEEFNPAISLLNPSNLYVEPVNKTTAKLSWSDRSSNENLQDGFELQRALDSSFTNSLVSWSLPSYTNEFTDNGLSPNTQYWYRVRARSGSTNSEYSNKVRTITPQSIVYVNFNYQVADGPSPWNNLATLPNEPQVFPGMLDQSGNNTGITLAIEKTFNGEFNAGKITGNNSGIAPDNVLQANFWLDNTQLSTVRVSGLNHSKRYRIGFFGSSSANGWYKGNYTATYTIGDRTVYLNSWENSTKIVYISDVVPDENGEVLATFSTTEIASYGFNAGMVIMAYNDEEGGVVVNAAPPPPQAPMVQQAREAQNRRADITTRTYPNPFNEQVNIDFFNQSASDQVSVEIFDMGGRMVMRKQYGQLPPGFNALRVNTAASIQAPGLYMINLTVNGKTVQSSKMVKTTK